MHSLAILLSNFPNIRLFYVSPAGLEMPAEIKEIVATKYENIEQVINVIDSIKFLELIITYMLKLFLRLKRRV